MLNEVAMYGQVLSLGGYDYSAIQPGDLIISPDTFNAKDPTKRPKGWTEIRFKRILVKEQLSRLNGVDEETIMNMRAKREDDEEAVMIEEIKNSGHLADFGSQKDVADLLASVSLLGITEDNFDPSSYHKRPAGWTELRHKRVLVKELSDRLAGIGEDAIASMLADRERKVCFCLI
jgi:hypothetical protein